MPEAQRTLVKSPPELWAEVSDPDSLAKHLESFGEIRITRVQPETTVAWEGDRACGTVELAASGWGTKVTLKAEPVEDEVEEEPALQQPLAAEEEPPAEEEPAAEEPPRRVGFFSRLFRRRRKDVADVAPEPEPEPQPEPEPVVEPEVVAAEISVKRIGDEEVAEVLDGVLDTLGAAHHRPFSR